MYLSLRAYPQEKTLASNISLLFEKNSFPLLFFKKCIVI